VGRTQTGHRDRVPTTVVVCGGAAQAASIHRPPNVPLTWIADLATLEGNGHRDEGPCRGPWTAADAMALVIEPAWLDSRYTVREAVAATRAAHADLRAGVLRDAELHDPGLAASAGLRAVLVRSFAAGRGSRRPPPAGWPCRNPAWGLWEVQPSEAPPRTRIWSRLIGRGPASGTGRRALVVLDASLAPAVVLQRWLDWAARGVAAGTAVAVTLPDVATILDASRVTSAPMADVGAGDASGRNPNSDRGSVLRAA
jgi:hypothetical protein